LLFTGFLLSKNREAKTEYQKKGEDFFHLVHG
jgi:hypothetical protein